MAGFLKVLGAAALILSPASFNITSCILSISEMHFRRSALVAIILPDEDVSLMRQVLAKVNEVSLWSIAVVDYSSVITWREKAEVIVFAAEGNISSQITTLRHVGLWNPRAKMLVVSSSYCCRNEECSAVVRPFLIDLLRAKAADSIALIESCTSLRIYSFPLDPTSSQCEPTDISNPVLLDEWLPKHNKFIYNFTLFPHKTHYDFLGCPLRISTFPWDPFVKVSRSSANNSVPFYDRGMEINILRTVAHKRNFSLVYLPVPTSINMWGEQTDNGSWTGILGNLHEGKADVGCASFTVLPSRTEYFDNTISYMSNAVSWIVPRARRVPLWKNILRVFSALFWLLLVISFFLAYAVLKSASLCVYRGDSVMNETISSIHFTASCNNERKELRKSTVTIGLGMSNAFLTVWRILLEQSFLWKHRNSRLSAFFLLWVWFCFLISTAYQSSLVSVLTHPAFETQIRTLDQLVESDLFYGYTAGLPDYLNNKEDPIETYLRNHAVFCPNVTQCLQRISRERDYALLSDKVYVQNLIPHRYLDSEKHPLIFPLDDDVMLYPVVSFVARGSILLEVLNTIIWRLLGSGLMNLWNNRADEDLNRCVNIASDNSPKVLTLAHLQTAFYLIILGTNLSAIVFCIELLTPFWRSKLRKSVVSVICK